MEKTIARAGLGSMIFLASAVGLSSFRYLGVLGGHWLAIDDGIRLVIQQVPWAGLTHMLIAPIALLVGALQFIPSLRVRRPQWHRVLGRIYVAACVMAGISGLVTAFHASGGPVAGWGFGILAVCWLASTLGAWRAAVRRQLKLHQLLMRLSYAMTFGGVTLRLQIPLGFALGYASYSQMSVWLAYTAWIPNVLVVALYSALEQRRGRTPVVRAAVIS